MKKFKKVFIIAEAGIAHFGSSIKAKKLVDLAVKAGADAVKFQSYITSDFIDENFKDWYLRYKIKEVNFDFLDKIKKYCKKKKIIFLCTPHTESVLEWVKKMKLPIIKIGSGELGNFEFLKKIIKSKKHIIVSTGMHKEKDMLNLRKFFLDRNFKNVSFLRCVSSYPTKDKNINLLSFQKFKKIFERFNVGYSDHTKHDLAIIGAVSMGAKIIEKHIALDFNIKNAQDWKVSFNVKSFRNMVSKIRTLEKIMGDKKIFITDDEKKTLRWATKGVYARENIKKNTKFTLNNTCSKRPNNGIGVNNYSLILNKRSKSNIEKGKPIKRNQIG